MKLNIIEIMESILKLCHKEESSNIKSNIFKLLTSELAEVNNIGLNNISEKTKVKNVNNAQIINLIIITSF